MATDPEDERLEDATAPGRFSLPFKPPSASEDDVLTTEKRAELDLIKSRFSGMLAISRNETYDGDGNLIVGGSYVVYTPEQRQRAMAIQVGQSYELYEKDRRISIALGMSPEPEDETDAARLLRLKETRQLAIGIAALGEPSVARELGYMPPPRINAQPRMVDADGNVVQEAIEEELYWP